MLSLHYVLLLLLFASLGWTFQSATTRRPCAWRQPTSRAPSSPMMISSRAEQQHRQVLRYKNHLKVQLDLAVGRLSKMESIKGLEQKETSRRRRRPWTSLFLLLVRWQESLAWHCRQCFAHSCRSMRRFFQKYTIYVLELQGGKYYVGSTSHKQKRWRQHWSGRSGKGQGAAWTRRHAPIRVVFQHKRVPELYYLGLEAKVTAEWMLKHGVNNVRGAMFAETRKYTLDDLDALTGFLGHYLDLSYHQVESVLLESLPAPDNGDDADASTNSPKQHQSRGRRRRKRMVRPSDVCFRCGEQGHWATDCPTNTPKFWHE